MSVSHDELQKLKSEGDINLSPIRKKWSDKHINESTREILEEDEQYFLHQSLSTPCLNALQGCEGSYLIDVEGRKILDFHGNSVHQVGFSHPKVIAAIKNQLDELSFCTRRYTNQKAIDLAKKLTSLSPGNLNRVLFTPGGTSAIGMALKLARIATGKFKTISMWDSFHGASLDAISLGGEAVFRKGIGPLLPGTEHVPPPDTQNCPFGCGETCNLKCAEYIDYVLEKEGDVAAVVAETVRCTPFIPPKDYWKIVREACDRHGALLILDEIPIGLGRTGKMFAVEHYGIVPDMLVLGKGMGGAVFPFAALLAKEELNVYAHGALGHYTHEKSPVGCAAALATIEVIEEENLLANSTEMGEYAKSRILKMKEKFPIIADVRGTGLLMGIELFKNTEPKEKALDEAEQMMYRCLEKGLSFKLTMGNILTLTPPLTISREEMDMALTILEECFEAISSQRVRITLRKGYPTMKFPRRSGIIAHPTSFPGRFGCGDLGQAAYQFVDFLEDAGQQIWQILPLGPTGYGDSPYQAFSAFAGNPYLINIDKLVELSHLSNDDVEPVPPFPTGSVDYGWLFTYKFKVLDKAAANFQHNIHGDEKDAFQQFCEENKSWLDDYALFAAVKDAQDGKLWTKWDKDIALHKPEAVQSWNHKLVDAIFSRKYQQFQFFNQWYELKEYANDKGISIMGDIPIYVALDSADAWANPDLYKFDAEGKPTVVAGVPPDYFSKTGQLWGNPIYRWDVHQSEGYSWWIDRFQHTLKTVDLIRIDHFRGFESYWEVPAGDKTAENGTWQKGPGTDLFNALENALGDLPIIAEDLGLITKEVEALRDELGFPGMGVFQFGFGDDAHNTHLPHNFKQNMAVYTGTHDNDTSIGWFTAGGGSTQSKQQIEEERDFVRRYFATDGWEIHWVMIRALMATVADTAIVPLQDVLGLGTEARMNTPGKGEGNWQWRYTPDQLDPNLSARLKEMVVVYGRTPKIEKED